MQCRKDNTKNEHQAIQSEISISFYTCFSYFYGILSCHPQIPESNAPAHENNDYPKITLIFNFPTEPRSNGPPVKWAALLRLALDYNEKKY